MTIDLVKKFLQHFDQEKIAILKKMIAAQSGLNESEIDFNDPQILAICKAIFDSA